MVQQCIRVYARLKPSSGQHEHYKLSGQNSIEFYVPKVCEENLIDNRKEHYFFTFERIFGLNSKQDEIFEYVAIPVIKGVLNGYNGTIFAYGQTGSGKTHTMSGNLKQTEDRGIIMRCIEYLFHYFEQNTSIKFSTSISYLEIYNENGFDLLSKSGHKVEDFEKVYLMEDKDQIIHLKNLSINAVQSRDEAYSLLFNGDVNREISQTPFNSSSTRSHCIFTFHLTSKHRRSIKVSKLHLVDLAGSERVSKTGADGALLTEAKYINLSLHHLEQVIVALSEKKRQHVPYRNCFLTSVLRDSLGGNCMTSMIATCSSDIVDVEDTLSTCRFAQRVSQIHNEMKINEKESKENLVEHLKQENKFLRMQMGLLSGENVSVRDFSSDEIKECEDYVDKFIVDGIFPNSLNDLRKIEKCFLMLRDKLKTKDVLACGCEESKKLENLIKLRDNEIEILVKELKKMKTKNEIVNDIIPSTPELKFPRATSEKTFKPTSSTASSYEQSNQRQEAFDDFKSHHQDYNLMKALKLQLKQMKAEAKEIGLEVNAKGSAIDALRDKIEKQRISRLAKGLTEADSSEKEVMNMFNIENESYNETVKSLRNIKSKYDQVESSLKEVKEIILSDFETWWFSIVNIK